MGLHDFGLLNMLDMNGEICVIDRDSDRWLYCLGQLDSKLIEDFGHQTSVVLPRHMAVKNNTEYCEMRRRVRRGTGRLVCHFIRLLIACWNPAVT